MGFPVGYTELLLPKLLLPFLSVFIFLRGLVFAVLHFLGLSEDYFFMDPTAATWRTHHHHHDPPQLHHSLSAALARDVLPVVRFSGLPAADDHPDSCAVCLHDFEDDDEVRLPMNCRHVFHRNCLDRWVGYDHRTCPLCRAPLVPCDAPENTGGEEGLWGDSAMIPEFYSELIFNQIRSFSSDLVQ